MFGAANTVTAFTLTYEPGANSLTSFVGADTDVGLHWCLRASIGILRFVGKKQDECRAKPRRIVMVFDENQTNLVLGMLAPSDDNGILLITASACSRH